MRSLATYLPSALAPTLVFLVVAGCGDEVGVTLPLTVEGRVTSSEDGAPVSGLGVELLNPRGLDRAERFAQGLTDQEGRYSVSGSPTESCFVPYMVVAGDPFDGYWTAPPTILKCTTDVQVINFTVTPDSLPLPLSAHPARGGEGLSAGSRAIVLVKLAEELEG